VHLFKGISLLLIAAPESESESLPPLPLWTSICICMCIFFCVHSLQLRSLSRWFVAFLNCFSCFDGSCIICTLYWQPRQFDLDTTQRVFSSVSVSPLPGLFGHWMSGKRVTPKRKKSTKILSTCIFIFHHFIFNHRDHKGNNKCDCHN